MKPSVTSEGIGADLAKECSTIVLDIASKSHLDLLALKAISNPEGVPKFHMLVTQLFQAGRLDIIAYETQLARAAALNVARAALVASLKETHAKAFQLIDSVSLGSDFKAFPFTVDSFADLRDALRAIGDQVSSVRLEKLARIEKRWAVQPLLDAVERSLGKVEAK